MGTKLSWTGLAMMLTFPIFTKNEAFAIAGAVILIIGVVLQWFDK